MPQTLSQAQVSLALRRRRRSRQRVWSALASEANLASGCRNCELTATTPDADPVCSSGSRPCRPGNRGQIGDRRRDIVSHLVTKDKSG